MKVEAYKSKCLYIMRKNLISFLIGLILGISMLFFHINKADIPKTRTVIVNVTNINRRPSIYFTAYCFWNDYLKKGTPKNITEFNYEIDPECYCKWNHLFLDTNKNRCLLYDENTGSDFPLFLITRDSICSIEVKRLNITIDSLIFKDTLVDRKTIKIIDKQKTRINSGKSIEDAFEDLFH